MRSFRSVLSGLSLTTAAAVAVVFVGAFSNLTWQPTPNRVLVPVESVASQTVMQVYYRYGFPGPGSYFEYHSDVELLHRTDDRYVADFALPGWRKLRAIRLDPVKQEGAFRFGPVEFGYQTLFRYVPLFALTGEEILARWEPNPHIESGSADAVDGSWTIRSTGNDPFFILPVSGDDWLDRLPAAVLWELRGTRMVFFLLAAGIVYLLGRLVRARWPERAGGAATPVWNRWWTASFLAAVAGLAFVVYEPYLTFRRLYLFKDVATDSVDVFWPVFLHLSDYFRSVGWPLWSFSVGVGQGVFNWVGDPFLFLLWMLPPEKIAFGLGWLQFLKIVAAALLFLGWLRLLGIGRYAASVAAVGLSFSAHMIIRGNWTHYAGEVVMVAFAVFAFECFLRRRIWQLLPLAILFLVIRGVYHTYVWSILFFGYALLRLWLESGCRPAWMGRQVLRMGGCYLLGLGLSAVFLLPNLFEIFRSPRVVGEESAIGTFAGSPLLALNEPLQWLSALYGLYAPDLLGRGSFYSGWANYLEGPHLYAGTLFLLLLPQCFAGRSGRLRVVLGLALGAVLLYLFVPYARYFLNAFSGIYYKTSSFWISLVVAGCGALALDNLVRRGRLNLWLLGGTLAVLMAGLWALLNAGFVVEHLRVAESYLVYRQVIWLLLIYSAVLVLVRSRRWRSAGLILLPLVVAWEVAEFAGQSSRDRLALRGDSMRTGAYYFDDSLSAVRMIQAADPEFYRIGKRDVSAHLNDALGQSYAGLSSYYSFNAGGYLAFLGPNGFDVDHLLEGHGSSYVVGPVEREVLAGLLSTKYFLARDWGNADPPIFYEPWGRAGDCLIYRNACFIPFGPIYHYWIDEERARTIPPDARELVALAAAIVPAGAGPPGVPELPEEKIARALEAAGDSPGSREALYREWAVTLGEASVEWREFGPNAMSGQVDLEQPGIVYLSIPEAGGWRVKVNGEPVEFLAVHFGFRGVRLSEGTSRIELAYFPPLMKAGIALTGGSLFGFLLLGFRFRRSGG